MKYVKLYVHDSLLHEPELSCEYSFSFLPNKLGNNDRIAGQNLPNIDGQNYIHQIVGSNIQIKWANLCFIYTWWHNVGNIYSSVVKFS